MSIRVTFDRSLAKGRYVFALKIAIMIMFIPLLFFISHSVITHLLSINSFLSDDAIDGLMSTYEAYLNPSFGNDLDGSERAYTLLIAYLGAFLLNGILISYVVSWTQNRRERWEKGDLHYGENTLGHFCIVIGGNEMVPDLVKQLLEGKGTLDYVLIMTNRDVVGLRKSLVSRLGKAEERVVIYYGERTSKEDLSLLHLHQSSSIYIIGEQLDILQSGSHHDVKNMECVNLISRILASDSKYFDSEKGIISNKKILCRVMFEYQSTFSVFQFTDVTTEISKVLDFRPFNYYETWAKKIFVSKTLQPAVNDKYFPLEGLKPITADSPDTVHLIVVGMSRMGIALGVEAAHVAHYPNFCYNQTENLRTRITFVDTAAKQEMQYVQGHYKELFALSRWRFVEAGDDSIYYNEKGHIPYDANDRTWKNPMTDIGSHSPYRNDMGNSYTLGEKIVDVDWEFIQGNLEMPTVQCYIRDAAKQKNVRLTIAICFPKDNQSFAGSLYLPDEVYEEKNNIVQVLVYQPFGDAMRQCFLNQIAMEGNVPSSYKNSFNLFAKLKAFGMMNSCYDIKEQNITEDAAEKLCSHYKATKKDIFDQKNEYGGKLGIKSTLKAGKSLAAQQWSNNYAAAHLWTKLRSIEWDGESVISDESVSILAQTEHIRWNMEQLLMGYAPLKMEEQKKIRRILECLETPADDLVQLSQSKDEQINSNQYPKVKVWLETWKAFDEEKTILKSQMSHLDICSYEELIKIDPEAFKYDINLTRVLPEIYAEIMKMTVK